MYLYFLLWNTVNLSGFFCHVSYKAGLSRQAALMLIAFILKKKQTKKTDKPGSFNLLKKTWLCLSDLLVIASWLVIMCGGFIYHVVGFALCNYDDF